MQYGSSEKEPQIRITPSLHNSITPHRSAAAASAWNLPETSQTKLPMAATITAPFIQRKVEDNVCLLIFDRPESGGNIFDKATLDELAEHLDFIEQEKTLKGVILSSAKKSIFVAGADLKTLLRQAQNGQMREFIAEGQRIFNRLAELKIPTCAAIHGAAAGGGYEVALACDWRGAGGGSGPRVGLAGKTPGIFSGWGGGARLSFFFGVVRRGGG